MFAVPGWSISADAPKAQEDPALRTAAKSPSTQDQSKPDKKGKRGHSQGNGVQITSENLAELWEKYIEGKSKSQSKGNPEASEKRGKKRRKDEGAADAEAAAADNHSTHYLLRAEHGSSEQVRSETKAKRAKHQAPEAVNGDSATANGSTVQHRQPKLKLSGKEKYEERIHKKQERSAPKPANTPLLPGSSTYNVDTSPTPSTIKPPFQEDSPNRVRKNQFPEKKKSKNQVSFYKFPINPLDLNGTVKLPSETHLPEPTSTNPHPKPPRQPRQTSNNSPSPPNTTSHATILPAAAAAPPPTSNLTPLQRTMAAKLTSSRFRHLNQTLYTTTSTSALQLFTTTPSAYTAYHAGFRAQVAAWPSNPIESFIADLKIRGKVRRMGLGAQKAAWRAEKKGKKSGKAAAGEREAEALPRTNGICAIADLGCGDAQLAGALQPLSSPKDLNFKIHSFDLAKGDSPNKGLITMADITKLPLKEGEVDIAICCLSLMGTNWVDVVDEVARVVRAGGEVWVAEIKSRFARPDQGKRKDPREAASDKSNQEKKKRKKGSGEEDGDDVSTVEIDSDPDILGPSGSKRKKGKGEGEPHVGAFVEVWRRRGFELNGEVDLGNKMFLKMRFVKRAGRGVERRGDAGGQRSGQGRGGKKFIDDAEDEGMSKDQEAKVLKPCVYKLR